MISRARVGSGAGVDSWIDIAVEAPVSDAQPVCEALVERELRRVFPTDMVMVMVMTRSCGAAPLPAAGPSAPGSYLLVDEHPVDVGASLVLAPVVNQCLAARAGRSRATTVHHSRFPDRPTCERVREQLWQANRKAAAETHQAAQDWLRDQLRDHEAHVTRACAAEKEHAVLEEHRKEAAEELRRVCGRARRGPTCEKATRRALTLKIRELEAGRAQRECALARSLASLVGQRLRQQAAAPSPAWRPAVCRPAQ